MGRVVGTASLKMNLIHWSLTAWSVLGREYTFKLHADSDSQQQSNSHLHYISASFETEYEGERGRAGFLHHRSAVSIYGIKISYLSARARGLVYEPRGKQMLHF